VAGSELNPLAEATVRSIEVRQALLEATVVKSNEVVSRPNMIVKIGHDCEINISSSERVDERFGLRFRADRDDVSRKATRRTGAC
jgi:hypothetical protein